ncbi:MAG: IS982 family transposase [Deltaproteobacteria bacterium]|nr:IS982 family transposase [Deltaproteobacteria bacterium]
MLDRLTEVFCEVDDFCQAFDAQWKVHLLGSGAAPRGPKPGLAVSEIITLLLVLHSAGFKYLKNFYQGFAMPMLRPGFPAMPCYEQFVTIQKRAFVPLLFFLLSRMGKTTGIYYIDSTSLPVCDNHRLYRHKTFAGLARRGKTSRGWFFGFKLHLVFNHLNQIVACKLTPGHLHDTQPVPQLTKHLLGKLFADKCYLGKQLAHALLGRGLTLFTRIRKNMKALPRALPDKLLLKARNMAETIIGTIKQFSSLNLPKHRLPLNAFLHLLATITADQINPIKPKFKLPSTYPLAIPA